MFRERARAVEAALPGWGRDLFTAAVGHEKAREALCGLAAGRRCERRFSVRVDDDPSDSDVRRARRRAEAATELLALPWELLHDGTAWLFQGRNGGAGAAAAAQPQAPARAADRVCRCGSCWSAPARRSTADGSPVGYIDHRASALPLVEAVESLGELVRLTVLHPPTYAALAKALAAGDEGEPFDVVHFDGHGVYDRTPRAGRAVLRAARPGTARGRPARWTSSTPTSWPGWSATTGSRWCSWRPARPRWPRPTRPPRWRRGCWTRACPSVVAMTHSVLVETARRFVAQFYADLATGSRVGTAMLAGQRALYDDPARGAIPGAGELRLQDWFVPVLYQEERDPQPVTTLPSRTIQRLAERERRLSLGALPEPPEHRFQGRSRDLLALERHLHTHPWVVIRGTGGQGKTTLAVELVRWLVRTRRAERAVFVSVEHHRDPAAVLDTIGRQLVGEGYSVAHHPDLDQALQPVERALRDQATIVLVDNCETLFPDRADPADPRRRPGRGRGRRRGRGHRGGGVRRAASACWRPIRGPGWCSPAGSPARPVRRPRRDARAGCVGPRRRGRAGHPGPHPPRRRPTGQRRRRHPRGGHRPGGGGGLPRPRPGAAGPGNRPRRGRRDHPRPAAADGPPGAAASRGSGELAVRQRRAVAAPPAPADSARTWTCWPPATAASSSGCSPS